MSKIITPDQLSSQDEDLPPELRKALAKAEESGAQVVVMSPGDVLMHMQGTLLQAFQMATTSVQKRMEKGEELTVQEATQLLAAQGQAASGMAALAAETRAQEATEKARPKATQGPSPSTGQYL